KVKDKDGVWGTVVSGSPHLFSNAAQVVVQTESGQQILVPTDMLVQQPDRSYYLPLRLAELEHSGSEHSVHQDKSRVVPVLMEELEVQKRPVETGKVRMTKVVHERETIVDEPLWHDNVAVTRVPMQRVVDGLIKDGFTQSDIHLAFDHTRSRPAQRSSVEWDSAYEGENLFETLTDLGVPHDEAHSYAEGVRRGCALVVVESSDDRAER